MPYLLNLDYKEKTTESLTGAVMTLNSERTIEQCLSSLRPHVDHLLVCDSYSTDGTLDIVKKYADKIIYRKFVQHYGQQRNYVLSHVNTDWLFFLDSDEYVVWDDKINAKNLMSYGNENNFDTFLFPRMWLWQDHDHFVNCNDKYLFPDFQNRLYRMSKNPLYTRSLHESPYFDADTQIATLSHYQYALRHLKILVYDIEELQGYVRHRDSIRKSFYNWTQLIHKDGFADIYIQPCVRS